MTIARWAAFARKAMHRPPRYVARRVLQEARRQASRPWSRVRPRLLTDRALLAATGRGSIDALWDALAASPFFLHGSDRPRWCEPFSRRYAEASAALLAAAERVLRHEFDLLGSGLQSLGERLPWHRDFKSGREWPVCYSADIDSYDLDRTSDIKVPWELSRCQHFATLGQAYWLTGDERFAREFVAEVEDWIASNPWMHGVNWFCTMDVALRAMSWMWGFHFFAGSEACRAPGFRSRFLRSLWLHGEHVAANIEFADVNGNHYLTDAVGLVYLGVFFGGNRRSDRWLRTGRAMVAAEILAQTSEDGVDFEKSTSYHRLVLEGFLSSFLLLRAAGQPVPDASWRRLERMMEFTAAYTKPDGHVPLVGDADDGRMQTLGTEDVNDHRYLLAAGAVLFGRPEWKAAAGLFSDEAFWLLGPDAARRYDGLPAIDPAPISSAFATGGFYVMRSRDAHVFIDCGEVGMHGRGGHGHNDILAFELFLNGVNVVTDCGAYLYTASAGWRNRFRSTAFHNTIQIDDEELNRLPPDDLWRVRYDAVPGLVDWRDTERAVSFRGSHSGYSRLDPPVTHERQIVLDRLRPLVVIHDRVQGGGRRRVRSRMHLDPALRPTITADGIRLTSPRAELWLVPLVIPPGTEVRIEDAWVSPSYGRKVPTACVVADVVAELPLEMKYAFAPEVATARQFGESLLETCR